ncbi:MAG: PSD1 and planctomycete cytochrome C domain-containing protein [Gemmataceae bacterium]|nr:PSD1 and planctomycete cytochrome C domain-containing protein [Gemmataceae bacterium]
MRLLLVMMGMVVPAVILAEPPAGQLPPAFAGTVDFTKDIRPILERSCWKCHSAEKKKGGLRLDVAKAALAGGNSGPVIVPGPKAAESKLLQLVAGLDAEQKMPPDGPALSAEEVGKLRAWIEHGAKFDKDDRPESTAKRSNHWSFQPVRNPAIPQVRDSQFVRNPIDGFILARLEQQNVTPAPEADRHTLLRRLCLDLTGLPPTLEQVDEFVGDLEPGAYERLVDRLLASPHYGERWGRHWLDAARYADSDGYEKDGGRPWAWRYRDWVIQAINSDMPYDRFVIAQLAGDLLPEATPETKLATGFHRNTLTNHEGGVDPEQYRVEQVIDRVNTTGKTFLGLTVGCAQCHDHKYDPISQREYYQFFSFFNSDVEKDIEAPVSGERERFEIARKAHETKQAELKAAVDQRKSALPDMQAKWEAGLVVAELRKLPAPVRDALLIEPAQRNDAQKKAVADHFVGQDGELKKLTKSLKDHAAKAPQLSRAPTIAMGPARKTHVMIRGDFLRPGVAVSPATPGVLPPLRDDNPGRLSLARWIVDPANPLTARVLTNWLWQHHFGRGLVTTPEDFGTQGDKPSHPELLDWLASEVIRRGWSLKQMHRLIVTSATYRQSSAHRPELQDRDPLNNWLARQNRIRLEGELVRDVALASSGLLNRTVGGPSVRPPQPEGISDLTYGGGARWVESKGPDRYRRGMYTWFQRTSPYPMLMNFDSPDSNVCVVRRERSNTPLQALTLMNDIVFVECSQSLGKRLAGASGSRAERIALGMKLVLGRSPTPAETDRLSRWYDDSLKLVNERPPEAGAWTAVARVLLNLDECINRE